MHACTAGGIHGQADTGSAGFIPGELEPRSKPESESDREGDSKSVGVRFCACWFAYQEYELHSFSQSYTVSLALASSQPRQSKVFSVLVQRAYTHSLSTPRQRSGCARPPHAPAAALFSGHRPTPATLKLNKSNSSDRKVWATFIFPPRFWTPGARGPAQAKEICAIRNKRPTIF